MLEKENASPPSGTSLRQAVPFARKLGFSAEHQRLLEAVMRGKRHIERSA